MPRILHENGHLLALFKPAGLDVFPSSRGRGASLSTWLLAERPGLAGVGDPDEPAIVHRLDRMTSGLMLAARDGPAYATLRASFQRGEVDKAYLALVEGRLDAGLTMDAPIGSRYRRSRRVSVEAPGKRLRGVRPARTSAEPVGHGQGFTLCRIGMRTGVRHQIRAHLAAAGHPVAGDELYGASRPVEHLGERFFLHAWRVELLHPAEDAPLTLSCPLPPELRKVLATMGVQAPLDLFGRG